MNEKNDIDIFAVTVYNIIKDYFDINLYRVENDKMIFRANPVLHKRGWKRELNNRLALINSRAKIKRLDESYNISVTRLPQGFGKPPLINILLFILTFLTVLIMSSVQQVGDRLFSEPALLAKGIPFTLTLLTILMVHEMGHFIAGHKRGVIMSYPYFIPAPTFIGTFGAVIKGRTPIRNRNDLILIGAAGPLAGAIPAIIALIWGLSHSQTAVIPEGYFLAFGDSLFTYLLHTIMFSNIPNDTAILLSPIALAGQVGLLVTMLNLLPIGQLDGGHIFYGILGKRQHSLARLFLIFLFILGFWWKGWWFWLLIAFFMKPYHPPVIEDLIEPDKFHKIIAWISIILFILTFVPRPIY